MKKCIRVLCMLLVAGCMVQAADPLEYGLVYDPKCVDPVNSMLGLENDGYDPSDFQMNSGQEWVPLPIPTDSPFHPLNSAVGSISAPSQDKGDDGGPAEYFGDDCDDSEPQQDEQNDDEDGSQSQVEYFGNDCDSMGMEPQQNHDASQSQIVADQNQLQQAVKRYNCSFCTYATDHEGFFNRHVRRHTGGKVYECQFCLKKCANSDCLRIHTRTHTGERPFKCPFDGCTAAFAQSAGLIRHRKIHTGQKPHKCRFCSRGFSDSSNKTKHEKRHLNQKP